MTLRPENASSNCSVASSLQRTTRNLKNEYVYVYNLKNETKENHHMYSIGNENYEIQITDTKKPGKIAIVTI
jgi:hypothetical protein